MVEQDTIRLLRECDAGVKMGISSIDDVLKYVKSEKLRKDLNDNREEHCKLDKELQVLLDSYHDDGKEPNPMAKGMSWMKTNMKLVMNESDHTIADLITDGCNMGVKSLNKYLNEYKAADEKSKDICKRLINLEEDLIISKAETEDIIVETLEEQTLEEDSEEVETEINIDSQEVSLEIVELDQANAIEIEDNSEIEIFEEEDISLDSFSEEDNELLEANDIEIFEHNTDNEAFKIPNFGCFNYEPENIGYDSEEILSYLLDIDEKHPERKILAICDLKYKKGLSVLEIASKLEFTEEEVLDILNEIIDTIKD